MTLSCSRIAPLLAFALPFGAYLATAAPCVGFDDAAELAWCAIHWGVPHPPGFPVWVALAHVATLVGSWVGDAVAVLHGFVALLGALACAFLQRAGATFVQHTVPSASVLDRELAGLVAALAFGAGMVSWQWANAVEVYSLQSLAAAALLWALLRAPVSRGWSVAVGVALGVGLANHHATMLVLAPFALAAAGLCGAGRRVGARSWAAAGGVAACVWFVGVVLLFVRAQGSQAFEFGNPDTVARLLRHLGGGFYGDGLFRAEADVLGRWQYLLGVTVREYGLFLVATGLGLGVAARRSPWLLAVLVAPWLVTCWVQAGRTMVANMDSYLLPAFALLALPVAAGVAPLLARRGARWVVLAALAAHAAWNLPACDRSDYDCGDALVADLDRSAPQGSVLLLAGWELRMLHRLYRDTKGFRPDLTVLAADVKGTSAASAEVAEPEFLARIRGPFDAYLAALAAQDPDLVHTDWFTLATEAQTNAYRSLVLAVLQAAREQQRPVLADRGAVAFLLQLKVVPDSQVFPCGNLFSVGPVAGAPPFLRSGTWWDQPVLHHDLCAAAVLRDADRTAEQTLRWYGAFGRGAEQAALRPVQQDIARTADQYRSDKTFLGWRERDRR